MTDAGRTAFAELDRASQAEMAALLARAPEAERSQLVAAMGRIERLLAGAQPAIEVRAHRPGDMGEVIAGHAKLYAEEYGWDGTFEAMVAEICAQFVKSFDAGKERCWIAEVEGRVVGSAFCVKASEQVAKLRLLYIDQTMRGRGLGRRLVGECIVFARARGYAKLTLWTNDILHAARRIYEAEGFVLVAEEKHRSFGKDLVGQTWELAL